LILKVPNYESNVLNLLSSFLKKKGKMKVKKRKNCSITDDDGGGSDNEVI
jgi:hypothetical protein